MLLGNRVILLLVCNDGQTMVALFTVMCRRDPHSPADYVEVKAFNDEAVIANDRLTEGTEIELHAFLRSESWTPKGKNAKKQGTMPAIVLINPKYAHNVGAALRHASCYGIEQLWFTGNRIRLDLAGKKRVPREERMKGYADVRLIHYDRPFDQFPRGAVPVAVEVREDAEPLFDFEHPENAVYVFGPEDGSLSKVQVQFCHRFVIVPTRHCLNLAMAVGTVLYDRAAKAYAKGDGVLETPGDWEERGQRSLVFDRADARGA